MQSAKVKDIYIYLICVCSPLCADICGAMIIKELG